MLFILTRAVHKIISFLDLKRNTKTSFVSGINVITLFTFYCTLFYNRVFTITDALITAGPACLHTLFIERCHKASQPEVCGTNQIAYWFVGPIK